MSDHNIFKYSGRTASSLSHVIIIILIIITIISINKLIISSIVIIITIIYIYIYTHIHTYIHICIYDIARMICIYIYIYIVVCRTIIHLNTLVGQRQASARGQFGCGQMGSALMGRLQELHRLGKKARPGTFGKIKEGLTGVPKKSLCQKK